MHSARRAGAPDPPLRLVIKPGADADLLPAILSSYAKRPGAGRVEIVFGTIADRAAQLHDGRADLALLYVPLDDLSGLEYRPLLSEERVAIVASGHRLARRAAIDMADLDGETLPRWSGVDGQAGDGPLAATATELSHLVALGRCVAVLPRFAIDPAVPGVAYVPVRDAEPSTIVLAWLPEASSGPLREFVAAAAQAAARRTARATGTDPSAARPAHDGALAAGVS